MSTIQNAAALIRDFDRELARVFLAQPFNRHTMITAFHHSLCKSIYAPMADRIAVALRSAVDAERCADNQSGDRK
jgi:hypothetical protein